MKKLSIFDDGVRIATITQIDSSFFLFARSNREWHEIKRLMGNFDIKDKLFLENVSALVQSHDFSIELLNNYL